MKYLILILALTISIGYCGTINNPAPVTGDAKLTSLSIQGVPITTQVLSKTWIRASYTNDWVVGNLVTNATTTNALDLTSMVPTGVNVIFLRCAYAGTAVGQYAAFYSTNDFIGNTPQALVRTQVVGTPNDMTAPILMGTNRILYYVSNVTNIPTAFNIRITGGSY